MNELPPLTDRNPAVLRLAENDRRDLLDLLDQQLTETAGDIPADTLAELTALYREVALRHTDAAWWLNHNGRKLGATLQREFTDADKARLAALRERFPA